MTEFDKYGNVKTPNYEQPKAKAKSNNYNTQANSNPKRDAELNFLKKVLNAVSSRNNDAFYQMEDKTWQNLAKVLGCEDYTLLKNGDRKEYIRLMKEYHPDICEDKEKGEIVTKILNAIREG